MLSIRARLTVWYAVALLLTLAVFGGTIYVNPPEPSVGELDRRTGRDADFAAHYLTESYRVLGRLVDPDSQPTLSTDISAAFEGLQNALVVLSPSGRVLYLSPAARELDYATLEDVLQLSRIDGDSNAAGTAQVGPMHRRVRYRHVALRTAGGEIGALFVLTPRKATPLDLSAFLNAMLLASPLVIGASILLGYWLAGTVARPLQGIMGELAAITDGRSLHRRIVVPPTGDEMTRLAITVNGMLARLETSFMSLRRFTADASHELKTPMMVLRAGVERALTHPRTPGEILPALDETLEEINRMAELVESLLTLARADEGRTPLAVEPTDLRALLDDVAETAGILGEEAGLRVETAAPEHPVMVDVDAGRIREMLLNLVTNAIKYTPAGGEVQLGLAEHGPDVVLQVRDTGIGIAAGDLPHIFDRFWRADPARSRTGERPGTGLGLAITKWIAEAHGGSITVQSRPGRGTIFTITLPRTGAEFSPAR